MKESGYPVGVSTACLYPMLTEQALLELCKRGIQNVEIFINAPSELEKRFLREIKSMLEHYGVNAVSMHPFTCELETMMFFTGYSRRLGDGLEYYKKYFEAMEYLGSKIFVLHGNNSHNRCPEEMYFGHFERFNEIASTFGVTVAQENVGRCSSGSLEFLKKMKAALGDKAKFVLDTKQAVRAGYDPYEFVNALGESICHIHISDYDDKSDCKLVGTGKLDCRGFVSCLRKNSVNAAIILELYSSGYKSVEDLKANCDYIKSCL